MWGKLDDGLWKNEKLLGVSFGARWLYIAGISFCGEQLTDGVITRTMAWKLAVEDEHSRPQEWIDELVNARLWHCRDDGSFEINDYLEYNPSRAEVTAMEQSGEVSLTRFRRRQRAAGQARAAKAGRQRGRFAKRNGDNAMSDPAGDVAGDAAGSVAGDPAGNRLDASTSLSDPVSRIPYPDPESDPEKSTATRAPDRGNRPHQDSRHCWPDGELANYLPALNAAWPALYPRFHAYLRQLIRRRKPWDVVRRALDHALEHRPENPIGYIVQVLKVEEPNFHEAQAIALHEAYKREEARERAGAKIRGYPNSTAEIIGRMVAAGKLPAEVADVKRIIPESGDASTPQALIPEKCNAG